MVVHFEKVTPKMMQHWKMVVIPKATYQAPLLRIRDKILKPILMGQVQVDPALRMGALQVQAALNSRLPKLPAEKPASAFDVPPPIPKPVKPKGVLLGENGQKPSTPPGKFVDVAAGKEGAKVFSPDDMARRIGGMEGRETAMFEKGGPEATDIVPAMQTPVSRILSSQAGETVEGDKALDQPNIAALVDPVLLEKNLTAASLRHSEGKSLLAVAEPLLLKAPEGAERTVQVIDEALGSYLIGAEDIFDFVQILDGLHTDFMLSDRKVLAAAALIETDEATITQVGLSIYLYRNGKVHLLGYGANRALGVDAGGARGIKYEPLEGNHPRKLPLENGDVLILASRALDLVPRSEIVRILEETKDQEPIKMAEALKELAKVAMAAESKKANIAIAIHQHMEIGRVTSGMIEAEELVGPEDAGKPQVEAIVEESDMEIDHEASQLFQQAEAVGRELDTVTGILSKSESGQIAIGQALDKSASLEERVAALEEERQDNIEEILELHGTIRQLSARLQELQPAVVKGARLLAERKRKIDDLENAMNIAEAELEKARGPVSQALLPLVEGLRGTPEDKKAILKAVQLTLDLGPEQEFEAIQHIASAARQDPSIDKEARIAIDELNIPPEEEEKS